ncbi:MAG: T9SS type A sorting domain-containing protein [Bacteroidetes bacterium]|nr:T9SS type A sorting domain-containing protein [Bacteroidota bacterium]
MKKYILPLGVFLIFCSAALSLAQWTQIGPNYGSSNDPVPIINDLYISGDTIYAVDNVFGLHFSTDLGVTWCETGYTSGNNNACAASNGVIMVGNSSIASRSTNFGANFANVIAPGNVTDLCMNNNLAMVSGSIGAYFSKNAGVTWNPGTGGSINTIIITPGVFFAGSNTAVYRCVDTVNFVVSLLRSVNAFAYDAGKVYVGSTTGVDYSSDGGLSWNTTTLTSNIKDIAAKGSNIYAISGTTIYKSTNNGQNWTSVFNSGTGLKQIRTTSTGVIAMDNTSIYYSTNNGTSWTQKKFGLMQTYTVFKTPTTLFSSTNNFGIYRSTNDGNEWTNFTLNIDFWSIRSFASIGSTIFCGMNNTVIHKSTNDGITWAPVAGAPSAVFSMLVSSNSTLFAGTFSSGIKYSTNAGANWTTTNLGVQTIYNIHENQGRLFAGGSGSGIYMSTDGGNIWNQFAIAGSPLSSFASINNYVFAGGGIGVYVSSNNGTTWAPTPFTEYTLCMASSGNAVFAGTDKKGFYVSQDYGLTWRNVNGNLGSKLRVSKMYVSGNSLYGATSTTSVVRAPISGLVDVKSNPETEMPKDYSLEQNYPNPFNPSTNINFKIKNSGFVSLKIYDILGNEIAEILNENKSAGSYSITFDAGKYNLSSGMYFYKLSANGFEDTKRMVMVK